MSEHQSKLEAMMDGREPPEAPESDLKRIVSMGEQLEQAEARVKQLKDELDDAKREANKLSLEDLPELMREVGVDSLTLNDGSKVTVKEEVDAAITERTREGAIKWLIDNGHGGLIKTEVAVRLGRGERETAAQICDSLAASYDEVELKEIVHPGTLKSWVKERLRAGDDIPHDLFNIFPYSKAKIER